MEDFFGIQRMCLRVMGHNLEEDKNHTGFNWRRIVHIGTLLMVLSAQWPMITYGIYNINDLALVTSSLSICLTNVLTLIKITTFLRYKRNFVDVMRRLQAMYTNCHDPEAKKILTDTNNTAMWLSKLYLWSVCSTALYFMIGPIIKMVWAKLTGTETVIDLPMPMRFSFDYLSTPGYEFCYAYTFFVTLSVSMYATAIDALFVSFTMNLRAHFQALQYFIQSNSWLKPDAALRQDFRAYIQYHTLLLKLADSVKKYYQPIVFGQFLMTSLQVCVIVYQLVTHMDTVMVLVIYVTFLSTIMLQLLIYCYGGEIIKNESLMVATAIQLSDWYRLAPKNRRILCLMMMRSQREVVIKAGFYEASLANFMTILKAALSYITLIQSIE